MDTEQCRNELMTQGLLSYPDAKRALDTFVNLVAELARKVIIEHQYVVKEVTGNNTLKEAYLNNIVPDKHITRVGVKMDAPDTYGIYLGIKWTQEEVLSRESPHAFLCVVFGTYKMRDTLSANLRKNVEPETVSIEDFVGQYWEVHVTCSSCLQGSIDQVTEGLRTVLTAFLRIVQKSGTLRTAISEQPA